MLKVAYIGFGNSVCRYHLPYVEKRKDFIDVKYIYRLETEINEEKESWYPGIKFTSSINEIMDDPDVNLVVVNTPDRYHVEYTMQALDHGKHVLCEKPFAMTAKEAKDVFDYAKEIMEAVQTGVLLTAKVDDKVNSMTISWGTLGIE